MPVLLPRRTRNGPETATESRAGRAAPAARPSPGQRCKRTATTVQGRPPLWRHGDDPPHRSPPCRPDRSRRSRCDRRVARRRQGRQPRPRPVRRPARAGRPGADHRLGPSRLVPPVAPTGQARPAWPRALGAGGRPLVVRSSSTNEDGGSSSMAGVFTSVLDVATWDGFIAAVDEVLASGARAGMPGARMAVLVQPQLAPRWGGVLFGADPVTGRATAWWCPPSRAGPTRWSAAGSTGGRPRSPPRPPARRPGRPTPPCSPAATCGRWPAWPARAEAFGGPQDIEWAIDHDGHLWLLQSRPITTTVGTPTGHVLGTGPLAETFPEPLSRLEADLWLAPLAEGLEQALLLTGTASARALRRSPVARAIDGWAGGRPGPPGRGAGAPPVLARLDPRPPARRLRAAWRTGPLDPGPARPGPRRGRPGRRRPGRRPPPRRPVQRRAAGRPRQRAAPPCGPCTATRPWPGC